MRAFVQLGVIVAIVNLAAYFGFIRADRVDFAVVFIMALNALERTYEKPAVLTPPATGEARRIA